MKLTINTNAFPDVPVEHLKEMLGVLPYWVADYDMHGLETETLKDFMEKMYYPNSMFKFDGEVLATGNYKSKYEDDSVMHWVGKMQCCWGTVYFYEIGILALPMPNGEYFVTRMD
tara:strand:+ start:265 stop:609 length:345 start_codon:yes stop_codon:yes gene_type:complete